MKKLLLSFLGIYLFTSLGFCNSVSLRYECKNYCINKGYQIDYGFQYCEKECKFNERDAWRIDTSHRKFEIDWQCYFDCRLGKLKPKGFCRMSCDQEFQKCYSECLKYSSPEQCVMKCNPGFNIWSND